MLHGAGPRRRVFQTSPCLLDKLLPLVQQIVGQTEASLHRGVLGEAWRVPGLSWLHLPSAAYLPGPAAYGPATLSLSGLAAAAQRPAGARTKDLPACDDDEGKTEHHTIPRGKGREEQGCGKTARGYICK